MDGIEILNQTEILARPNYFGALMLIILIVMIAGLICLYKITPKIKNNILQCIAIIIFITITVASVVGVGIVSDLKTPTGEYEYQVTIDDSVSFTEFNEKYEIISQEGKIFTVKERK